MSAPSWDTYPVIADKSQTLHRRDIDAENAALECLDRFMTAFNFKDGKAIKDTFNFPSYRLVGNPPVMHEIDEETLEDRYGNGIDKKGIAWPYLKSVGWHHSSWDRRNIIWSQSDKVHLDCCFSRYRLNKDGSFSLIGVYESVYIVSKNENGHWGIQLRSTSADAKAPKSFVTQNKKSKL